MKRVLIGHRGVGKSSLLQRHQYYFPEVIHFDLDVEIQKKLSMDLKIYFELHGEEHFREIELEIFNQLTQNHQEFVIAVGGGFNPLQIPESVQVVFIQRSTDVQGRLFLNRPALNPNLSPLDEYFFRYQQRQPRFIQRADFIYDMPEGLQNPNELEKEIMNLNFSKVKAYLTLNPMKSHLIESFHQIELRTDLFSHSEIQKLILNYPKKNFLISYRKPTNEFFDSHHLTDWALELGEIPSELLHKKNLVVSSHAKNITDGLKQLSLYPQQIQKLCPVVNSWSELIQGYQWQSEQPLRRNFLPRSPEASTFPLWKWLREWISKNQKINFVSYFSDFKDQPSVYDFLKQNQFETSNYFGAVIGYPVNHSKTPEYHSPQLGQNFYQIPMTETDFKMAFQFLDEIGLNLAAVTSPLKDSAGKLMNSKTPLNSLKKINNQWMGTSTDEFGFSLILQQITSLGLKNIVIWGGGGILPALQKILPEAILYSATTAKPRDPFSEINHPTSQSNSSPQCVIWAAPRLPDVQWPSDQWKPQIVLDINYQDHSMGKEYALRCQAQYISGDDFFYAQAKKQMEFFKGES